MSNTAVSRSATREWSGIVASCFLAAGFSLFAATVSAEPRSLRLRLKGGDYADGTLLPSDKPGYVRLQCPAFVEPLEFEIQRCSIEHREPPVAANAAEQLFRLTNGAALAGSLTALDETKVVLESPCLGQIQLPRAMLREFVRNSGSGRLVYSGPRSSDQWTGTTKDGGWRYEGSDLVASEPGVTVIGNVNLPARSEVRLSLTWSAAPSFSLALGCSKPTKPTERIASAASLEVWDETLMMVREGHASADIMPLPDLLDESLRLDLLIFLDQVDGVMAVCTPNGRLLGKLQLTDNSPPKLFIALTNHGKRNTTSDLRLERLEVRQWNGQLPKELPATDDAIETEDGQVAIGKLASLDEDGKQVTLVGQDGETSQILLEKIRRAILSTPDETPQASAELIGVELSDGSHLVGAWLQMDSDKVEFKIDGLADPVRFLLDDVVGVTGKLTTEKAAKTPGTVGQLQTEAATLTGCLADSEGDGILRWHPEGAAAAVQLAATSEGKIQYDLRAASRKPKPARNTATARIFGQGVMIINGRPQNARLAPTRKSLNLGLKLRRGDEIGGKVTRIDERGITFESGETNTTFLPNAQMDSVILASSRAVGHESPEKLKRLMTVPRSSKNDPPTHLLVSVNGDYLRGRLIEFTGTRVIMEVRLENVELPADQIAEIHWLYRRDWQDDKPSESEPDSDQPSEPAENSKLQVHIIRRDGRPLSFLPKAFSNQTLQGNSDLLGDCQVGIANVTTLLFGTRLSNEAREVSQEAWKLSLATLPKVYQESEAGPGESSSPLVGKPAPEFTLNTATGEKFELNKQRGRVLVIDFWASWCGPCLETMPEVERIINEIGDDRVDLIAVNLQETKERAMATIKRLGLSPTLVLDTDGSVAQQYQATAIPQTVIIDREGNVTHLFIGGGPRFLTEFTEALSGVLKTP